MSGIERKAALPCIVCGTAMDQAMPMEGITNQPSNGVSCWTHGNYGSTVFDSICGDSRLLFSVCDECLVKAAGQERVLWQRDARPVYAYMDDHEFRTRVGWERLDRPAIPWQPHTGWENDETEQIEVEPEDVGTKMGTVEWR